MFRTRSSSLGHARETSRHLYPSRYPPSQRSGNERRPARRKNKKNKKKKESKRRRFSFLFFPPLLSLSLKIFSRSSQDLLKISRSKTEGKRKKEDRERERERERESGAMMRMVIEQIVLIRRLSLSLSLLSILSFVFSRFSYLFSLSWFSRSVATRQSKLFRKVFQKSRYERSFPYARGPAHYESARRRLLLLFPLGGRHGNAAPHETKKLSVSLSLSLSSSSSQPSNLGEEIKSDPPGFLRLQRSKSVVRERVEAHRRRTELNCCDS